MKTLLLVLAAALIVLPAWADAPAIAESSPQGTLTVTIHGFDNTNAQAMIALHNSKKTFLKKAEPFRRAILPIAGETVTHVFENVPYGEYSVAVFQDDNKNMDLDLGVMFIPKERYGFSNDARGKFGPPKYDKTTFELASEKLEMTITIAKQ